MNILKHFGERMFAWARSTVALVKNVGLIEAIRAPRFRYDYQCVGPREVDRPRYVALRDRIRQLSACVDETSRNLLRTLSAEFDAIPLEPKWAASFWNTVCTGGKNDLLDKYFAGSSYTATWYLMLISSVSYSVIAAADTMASHAGWTEAGPTNAPNYSQSTRVALTFSAASAGSKATSAASAYSITATGTVKGGAVTSVNTKDGTTGILYSAGLFSGGDRAVINGDTLNCSLTVSV
jgi:hypothetical protein